MAYLITVLIKWRKFVVASSLIAVVGMAVISLVLPKWYTARTSVFPPETGGGMSMYADIIQSFQVPLLGPLAGGAAPGTIYIDILMSHKIGSQIIEEFGLKEMYGQDIMSEALQTLHSHCSFSILENGLLHISYEDKDPEQAAAVANRLAVLLDEFNRQLNITRASRTREFVEEQLEARSQTLAMAEEDMRKFQEENETLEIEAQINSSLDVMSGLAAQAIALEVEMEILSQFASKSSDEYKNKKRRYDKLLGQLKKFKVSSARDEEDFVRSFFPTLDKVPQVTLEFLRLTRRVKIEEAVYELLVKEYEKSRIDEARDTPTIQVLDEATVPEIRSRPKRKLLVVVGGLVGFGWSALIAIIITIWREQGEQRRNLQKIFDPVVKDFSRIFRRNN
jgi:uncharacterized protein involved in exopolysaccharide biosynthesis